MVYARLGSLLCLEPWISGVELFTGSPRKGMTHLKHIVYCTHLNWRETEMEGSGSGESAHKVKYWSKTLVVLPNVA